MGPPFIMSIFLFPCFLTVLFFPRHFGSNETVNRRRKFYEMQRDNLSAHDIIIQVQVLRVPGASPLYWLGSALVGVKRWQGRLHCVVTPTMSSINFMTSPRELRKLWPSERLKRLSGRSDQAQMDGAKTITQPTVVNTDIYEPRKADT